MPLLFFFLLSIAAKLKSSQLFSNSFSCVGILSLFLSFLLFYSTFFFQILLCFVRIDKYFINSLPRKSDNEKKAAKNSANHWHRIILFRCFHCTRVEKLLADNFDRMPCFKYNERVKRKKKS